MARKQYKNPIIELKGFSNIYDLLNSFPFDIAYKNLCLSTWLPNGLGIPQIINEIKKMYFRLEFQRALANGDYKYLDFLRFRLTTSNKQFELSYELKTNIEK